MSIKAYLDELEDISRSGVRDVEGQARDKELFQFFKDTAEGVIDDGERFQEALMELIPTLINQPFLDPYADRRRAWFFGVLERWRQRDITMQRAAREMVYALGATMRHRERELTDPQKAQDIVASNEFLFARAGNLLRRKIYDLLEPAAPAA